MEEIFSTKERIRILKEVIFWEGEIGVNELSAKVKLSKVILDFKLNIDRSGTKYKNTRYL